MVESTPEPQAGNFEIEKLIGKRDLGMGKGEPPKEATLVGWVVPVTWDNEGNVIRVRFQLDKESYEVELNEVGEELFDFLDEEVKVTGIVSTTKNGVKRIRIRAYEVLRGEEGTETP